MIGFWAWHAACGMRRGDVSGGKMRWLRAMCGALLLWAGMAGAAQYRVDLIQLEPWAFANPDPASREPFAGIIVELLKEFEKRSGHTTRKTLTPYLRVERDLASAHTDFTIIAWDDARAAFASKGVVIVPLEFGVRAKKGVELKSYEDLRPAVISVSRGLRIEPRFDADETLKKDWVVDYTTGINKTLANHGTDAVAGSLVAINYIIKKIGAQERFGDALVLRTVHLSVTFAKKSPLIDSEASVNAVFKAIVEDGTAGRIVDKWLK
jgi:polar amino acid transport system substrate-binding protein